MKKHRITESEMDSTINSFMSLENGEKMKWEEAIKQCMDELGFTKEFKSQKKIVLYFAALAAAGIALNIVAVVAMAALGTGFLGYADKGMITKVIKCAREKRKMDSSSSTTDNTPTDDTQIQESKNKKTIRLSESELIRVIKKIIKESNKR